MRKKILALMQLLLLSVLFLSPPTIANTPKHFTITPNIVNELPEKQSTQLEVKVQPYIGASYYKLIVESSGLLQADYNNQYTNTGAFSALIPVQALSNSTELQGQINITALAYDSNDLQLAMSKKIIYGYRNQGIIYLSASSLLDAQLHALQTNTQGSGSQNKQVMPAIDELFRAPAIETNTPIQREAPRVPEVMIDEAFPVQSQNKILAKPAALTVQGQIQWTDQAGNTHPLPNALVEIYDKGSSADANTETLLITVFTNASGNYTAAVSHDDGAESDNPDIFIRVLASSTIADIKPPIATGTTYSSQSSVHENQAGGTNLTINLTTVNTNTAGQAFSIHHALVAAASYIHSLHGSAPAKIDVRFPTTESTSVFDGTELHLLELDRWDWDVIHHEYGHYIMDAYNFENHPGGDHNFNENLSIAHGKDQGIRLAWGEGWPTFFAVSGQRQMGLASLGIANIGDLAYQDTEDGSSNLAVESIKGVGEDDEASVIATLWDLTDTDQDNEELSIPAKQLYSNIQSNSVTTLAALWNRLAADRSNNEDKATLGKLFAENNIAPKTLTPDQRASLNTSTRFSWRKNGAGATNPLNDFNVRFFDSNFQTATHRHAAGNTDHYTPTAADITAATSSGSLVRWVVTGKNTSNPATPGSGADDEYWSDAGILNGASIAFVIDDTGSMAEEIGGVRDALSLYIDSLEGSLGTGTTPPTIHLLTFKDNVTHRITTNDLTAMRAAVSNLSASGGGDCPEFSAHGLLAASQVVANGGTILLATDASAQPGVEIGAVLSDLRSRGITVNTILSGDCTSSEGSLLASSLYSQQNLQQKPSEDGTDGDTGGTIDDPGTAAVADFVGDTVATATEISLNGTISGMIEETNDQDYFKIALEANVTYALALYNTAGFTGIHLEVRDKNDQPISINNLQGFTQTTLSNFSETPIIGLLTPTTSDHYYIRIKSNDRQASYQFIVGTDNNLLALTPSSVKLFSVIAAETGGAFASIPAVNAGDDSAFVSTIFNILRSTLEPAIINSSITTIPQSAKVTVTVTGRNTNWNSTTTINATKASGTTVNGLSISNIRVLSPTSLQFDLTVADGTELGAVNLNTTTTLGSTSQKAAGISLITITAASTTPRLLSITPGRVLQGASTTLTIQGINTSFTDTTAVTLGNGITINKVTVVSPTELTLTISVDKAAGIGFRTLRIGTLTLNEAILVGAESTIPVLNAVNPASVRQGETASLILTGANTHFAQGVTTANLGEGINVSSVTINNSTEAVVKISVNTNATIGFRDITLTTTGETATLLKGLFVDASIPITPVDPTPVPAEPVTVSVPTLSGLTEAEARKKLETLGLVLGTITRTYHATIAKGQIISQSPIANTKLAAGSSINLVISDGIDPTTVKVTVPDLSGLTETTARSRLDALGLTLGTVNQTNHATINAGLVIGQFPTVGTTVSKGSSVNLTLSTGPVLVTLPDLSGLTEADARSKLTALGLSVGTIETINHATVGSGHVISQTPAKGSKVKLASQVNLVISKGPKKSGGGSLNLLSLFALLGLVIVKYLRKHYKH